MKHDGSEMAKPCAGCDYPAASVLCRHVQVCLSRDRRTARAPRDRLDAEITEAACQAFLV